MVSLVIVAALMTLYGFADTWHRTHMLREQGNDTGADSVWTHFLLKYVGGWVGALAGIGLARNLRQPSQPPAIPRDPEKAECASTLPSEQRPSDR